MSVLTVIYNIFVTLKYLFFISLATFKFKCIYSQCIESKNDTMALVFAGIIGIFYWAMSFKGFLMFIAIMLYAVFAFTEKINKSLTKDELNEFAKGNKIIVKVNDGVKITSEYVFFAFKPIHDYYAYYLNELTMFLIPPDSSLWLVLSMIPMFFNGNKFDDDLLPVSEDGDDEIQRKLDAILDETNLDEDYNELAQMMTMTTKPRLCSEDMVTINVQNDGNDIVSNSLPNTPT